MADIAAAQSRPALSGIDPGFGDVSGGTVALINGVRP